MVTATHRDRDSLAQRRWSKLDPGAPSGDLANFVQKHTTVQSSFHEITRGAR